MDVLFGNKELKIFWFSDIWGGIQFFIITKYLWLIRVRIQKIESTWAEQGCCVSKISVLAEIGLLRVIINDNGVVLFGKEFVLGWVDFSFGSSGSCGIKYIIAVVNLGVLAILSVCFILILFFFINNEVNDLRSGFLRHNFFHKFIRYFFRGFKWVEFGWWFWVRSDRRRASMLGFDILLFNRVLKFRSDCLKVCEEW